MTRQCVALKFEALFDVRHIKALKRFHGPRTGAYATTGIHHKPADTLALLGSGHYLRQGGGSVEFRKSLACKTCPPSIIVHYLCTEIFPPPSATIHTYNYVLIHYEFMIIHQ